MDGRLHYPDGLTEGALDALIAEVDAMLMASPVPTSRLLSGAAAERYRRRVSRRAVASVVRALPLTSADGEAA